MPIYEKVQMNKKSSSNRKKKTVVD